MYSINRIFNFNFNFLFHSSSSSSILTPILSFLLHLLLLCCLLSKHERPERRESATLADSFLFCFSSTKTKNTKISRFVSVLRKGERKKSKNYTHQINHRSCPLILLPKRRRLSGKLPLTDLPGTAVLASLGGIRTQTIRKKDE